MAAAVHCRARARSVQEPPCCLPVRGAEGPLKREAAPDVHGRLPSHSPLVAPRPPVLVRGPRQHTNPKPVPFTFKWQRQDLPSTEGGGLGDGLDVARSYEEPPEKASLPPTHPSAPGPPFAQAPPSSDLENMHLYYLLKKKGRLSLSRAVFATTVAHGIAPSIVPASQRLPNQAPREFRERWKQRRSLVLPFLHPTKPPGSPSRPKRLQVPFSCRPT